MAAPVADVCISGPPPPPVVYFPTGVVIPSNYPPNGAILLPPDQPQPPSPFSYQYWFDFQEDTFDSNK